MHTITYKVGAFILQYRIKKTKSGRSVENVKQTVHSNIFLALL